MKTYLCALIVFCVSTSALATKPTPTPPPSSERQQEQQQSAQQSQDQGQDQNQSQATESNSFASNEQGQNTNVSVNDSRRTTAFAWGTTAPAPLHATPECFLPAKGIRRIRQVAIVSLDSRLVLDETCKAELKESRQYARDMVELEIRRLELEIQRTNVVIDRMEREKERNRDLLK